MLVGPFAPCEWCRRFLIRSRAGDGYRLTDASPVRSSRMQRRVLGLAGEHLAERELERRGLRIVARNVRTRIGEIDLVCRDRDGYAFIEVKTRRAGSFVAALEAVDRRKAQRLAVLAESWLAAHGEREARWRILLAALTVGADGTTVDLLPLETI